MEPNLPTFPLRHVPTCRQCGNRCNLQNAQSSSRHNAGRPYYNCRIGHDSEFSTFDDEIGVVRGNPPCDCNYISRKTMRNDGQGGFYKCAMGICLWSQSAPSTPTFVSSEPSYNTWSRDTTPTPETRVPPQELAAAYVAPGGYGTPQPNRHYSGSSSPPTVRSYGTPQSNRQFSGSASPPTFAGYGTPPSNSGYHVSASPPLVVTGNYGGSRPEPELYKHQPRDEAPRRRCCGLCVVM